MSETGPPPDLSALLAACVAATDTPIAVADAAGAGFPLVYVNPAFERVSGYRAAEAIGVPDRFVQGADIHQGAAEAMRAALLDRGPAHARLLNRRPDGSSWWNDVSISPVRDDAGTLTHFVGVQHDVSDQVAAEERSAHAATHDWLTGLANRGHFAAQLDRELARARRDHRSLAVLFLDIDRLKAINDAHGHAAGDALLTETARRLSARLRGVDLVARYGGDEFLVLLVDLPDDGATQAALVVDDLTDAVEHELDVGGTTHQVSVSIGVSLYPRDAVTASDLIAHADAAMYRAKPHRRDGDDV